METEGSVCLTSVSVGGLVEHEHGIVDLRGDKHTVYLAAALPVSPLPRGILPDLSPSQVLQGGSATDGRRGGGGGGGDGGTGDERQVTKRRPRGQRHEGKYEEVLDDRR